MTAKSYEEATVVVTRINQLSALRNFSDFRKNKCQFVCSWVYDICFIIFLCFVAFHATTLSLGSDENDEANIVYALTAILFAFGFAFTVIIGLRNSKDILVLQKRIDEVDAVLKTIGIKINYRSFFFHVTISAFIWSLHFINVCVYCLVTYLKEQPNISEGRLVAFVVFTVSMFAKSIGSFVLYDFMTNVQTFIIFASYSWLELRFKQTNKLLKTFLLEDDQIRVVESNEETAIRLGHNFQNKRRLDKCSSKSPISSLPMFPIDRENVPQESQPRREVHSLQRIRSVHLQLCNVSKMLSQIYNTQLLFFVYTLLTGAIVLFYYLYMEIDELLNDTTNLDILFVYIVENLINCLKIVITCYRCERMMSEANKATEIIQASSSNRIDADFNYEINQFCLQILFTQLRKSKTTSLVLNWTFIRGCGAFISTYLVIMVQWSANDQTSKNETTLIKKDV